MTSIRSDEARALLERSGMAAEAAHLIDEFDGVGEISFSPESQSFPSDYSLDDAKCLIVSGDLIVTGMLETGDASVLIVTGKVTCESMFARGAVVVQGAVEANGFVWVSSGNDYSFLVDVVRSRVFVEHGTASSATRFQTRVFRLMNDVFETSTKRHFEKVSLADVEAFVRADEGMSPANVQRLLKLVLSQGVGADR